MLYLRMGFNMLVSLYTSRIVLNVLGVEDFGIYNLVGGVIVLFSFISTSLNVATQRFLTFELGKNDILQFNRIFNVSLISLSIVSFVLLLLFETIGVWFINNKLVIDSSRLLAAHIVFQISILSFIININTTPYNSAILAYEKMSIYTYVGILETFLKLFAVFILQLLPYDKLILYSILILVITFLTRFFNVLYCKFKIPGTVFHYAYDKILLRKLLSFSGWSLMGSIGNILSVEGIHIVFNLFYGVVINASFGISSLISNSIFQFVSNFQMAFAPQITKLYAINDVHNLNKLIFRSSRFSFFLLLIVVFPVILSIDNVLFIWLKIVPEYTSQFCIVILCSMIIDSISGPLWMFMNATGDIKKYQICMSFIASLNIVLIYFFLILGFSPNIALISRIVISILLLIARLTILKEKAAFEIKPFILEVIIPLIFVVFIITILGFIINLIVFSNILVSVFFKTIISVFVSIFVIYFVGIIDEERFFVNKFFKDKFLILIKLS